MSKDRAGSCHKGGTNLVANIQVFFPHCMKWFAAADTLFKEIHHDSSGGAAGEPQGLEQTVAPQTGGDMTTLRSDMLLKKKKI